MSKLEELIKEYCPNGVEYKTMEELFQEKIISSITPSFKVKRNDYKDTGECPIISQEEEYISGYYDRVDKNIGDNEYVCFGDHSEHIKYVNFRFVQGADGLKIITSNNKKWLNTKFLYYAISNFYKKRNNYERHFKYLTELHIPLPALPVQREIVRVLDSFTLYSAELTAELTARRKQYEFYRDKLLLGNGIGLQEITILDMLSQPITDGPHETPEFVNEGVPFLSAEAIVDNRLDFSRKRGNVTKEYDLICARKYKPRKGDVFMCKSGSTTGKVAINDTNIDFNIWSPLAAMRVNSNHSAKFLYYLLQSADVQNQVKMNASHGSQPNLSMRKLEQFRVKVPPMEVQERIVKVLDNFDAICSDLGIGLPAEIEKRQKQYEYYREKLLTFDMNPATIFNGTERNGTERNGTERNGTERNEG